MTRKKRKKKTKVYQKTNEIIVMTFVLTTIKIQKDMCKTQVASITPDVWNVNCDVVRAAFTTTQWVLITLKQKQDFLNNKHCSVS